MKYLRDGDFFGITLFIVWVIAVITFFNMPLGSAIIASF